MIANKLAGMLLVATAIAAPTTTPAKTPKAFIADFEEFNPNPDASLTLVPTPYKSLVYASAAVAPNAPLLEPLSFTTPSGKNYIASTVGPTTLTPDSPVDTFSVSSLLAGTYLNAGQGATAAGVDSTIEFRGVQKSKKTVSQRVSFDYEPSLLGVSTVAQKLRPVTLNGFKDLISFSLVVVEPSAASTALVGTVADKIAYTVTYK